MLFWRFDFNLHAQICTQLACNWASRWMAVRSVVAHPVVLSPSSSPVMPFFLRWTQVYPNSRKDFGINRITIALLTSLYLGLNFSTHLSDEFCLTARESLALILRGGGGRENILSEHLLAVSQLAQKICVLCACEQMLREPAKIMPLAAKRRGTWSPITGSKLYKIMLNNSRFLDLIKMKG